LLELEEPRFFTVRKQFNTARNFLSSTVFMKLLSADEIPDMGGNDRKAGES
jgi:hypothetical protein